MVDSRKCFNNIVFDFDDVHVTDSGSEDSRPITERCLDISYFQQKNIATYQNKNSNIGVIILQGPSKEMSGVPI